MHEAEPDEHNLACASVRECHLRHDPVNLLSGRRYPTRAERG
jgi:hypothetical protein